MKRNIFTKKQQKELRAHRYIEKCTNAHITYSPTFKRFALQQWYAGKKPTKIFEEAGIDISMHNTEYPARCMQNWKTGQFEQVNSVKYTATQLTKLKRHPCVHSCTPRDITYTPVFRRKAVALYQAGCPPHEIFSQAGFDFMRFSRMYMRLRIKNWRILVKEHGIISLDGMRGRRKKQTKRPDDKEKIRRLEIENTYLRQVHLAITRKKR